MSKTPKYETRHFEGGRLKSGATYFMSWGEDEKRPDPEKDLVTCHIGFDDSLRPLPFKHFFANILAD